MDTATVEDKFHHAVELIKSLPKTGNFQPSNDLKLRFYSYFKQATEGPCDVPKPSFWDVVGKAKWEAWNSVREMSKEEAMERYVNEFVQIIKSAPFDEKAKDYVHLMGPFISLAPKDFQEKHINMNGKVSNRSNNSEATGNGSEEMVPNSYSSIRQLKGRNPEISSESSEESPRINGINNGGTYTESESEEFSDTIDQVINGGQSEHAATVHAQDSSDTIPDTGYYSAHAATHKGPSVVEARGGADQRVVPRGSSNSPISGPSNRGRLHPRRTRAGDFPSHNPSYSANGGSGGRRNESGANEPLSDVNEQLAFAVIRLQHTMDQVVSRLDSLEALLQEKSHNSCVSTVKNSFSSIFGIPPRAALLIIVWPFIANLLLHIIQKRRRRGL